VNGELASRIPSSFARRNDEAIAKAGIPKQSPIHAGIASFLAMTERETAMTERETAMTGRETAMTEREIAMTERDIAMTELGF
jgi:hypothetical protein